jgi:hypothetical protein
LEVEVWRFSGAWSLEFGASISVSNFQAIIFNQRVAQKLVARGIKGLSRGFLIGAVEFDLQEFADVNGFDAGVPHVFQGFQNRNALRVNDGFLWGDDDFSFHARAGKFCGKISAEASQKVSANGMTMGFERFSSSTRNRFMPARLIMT